MEGLRSYFYILNIRFPRSLSLNLKMRDDMDQDYQVPAMILQPLVENSVIHAFKGVERKGSIIVRVWQDDMFMRFSVKDNGVGMQPEIIESLMRHTSRTSDYSSKVMGLENVIQRLYFFYPDNKEIIEIHSAPEEGTEVLININMEEEPCITL